MALVSARLTEEEAEVICLALDYLWRAYSPTPRGNGDKAMIRRQREVARDLWGRFSRRADYLEGRGT